MPKSIGTGDFKRSSKVSPGDNRNISCLHHGEQATACPIMQQTTIYHCPQDGFACKPMRRINSAHFLF
ncbi:hypothetical protein [Acetobacterium bakii]|uniref:Uncharacterized protein n=1 Tax=Acetobacterium bakii TaxID=52689 RepID=A0A0L6TX19_9FIRM|nr:hypothetical protein [Acetobacterium bakii]KNZ40622.1 hypothetical protein AKG39_16505 [Acetobacterium bakii]